MPELMTRLEMLSWAMAVTLLPVGVSCSRKEPAPEPIESAAAPATRATAAQVVVAPKLPVDLGTMNIPPENPQSDAKVQLGRQLFFDKRLSVDGSRACYSCHLDEDGTGGHEPTAIGAKQKKLPRHSPVLWNVGYLPRLYWDGRADSLEKQALGAWSGGNMGVGKDNLDAKAQEIAKIAGYQQQFSQVFGKEGVTPATIVKAIAAYERTLVCDDTAYDRYVPLTTT
jgi:cytochrome c peroxidase